MPSAESLARACPRVADDEVGRDVRIRVPGVDLRRPRTPWSSPAGRSPGRWRPAASRRSRRRAPRARPAGTMPFSRPCEVDVEAVQAQRVGARARPVHVPSSPGRQAGPGTRHREVAVVAQPAVQVERRAATTRSRGPTSRPAGRSGPARERRRRRRRRSRRRGPRRPCDTARRRRVVGRMSGIHRAATSCATPDRRCRSSRRAGRR